MFFQKTGPILILIATLFSLFSAEAAPPTRSELEAQYYTWRQALMRGDYELWKNSTAFFRQRMVRNLAVSEKKPFPESLFQLPMRPPSLSNLKHVGIIAKGPTAASTYYGKVDFGIDGTPTDNAYVLLFAYEKNEWKYDTARFFNLSQLKEVKERLEKGDKKVLEEQDGFQPLGYIPPAPPLCPKPQFISKIFVDCPGRKVEAVVNGVSSHTFENTREAVIISGGLHQGSNSLNYTISPIPGEEPAHLTIGVYIMPEVPGNVPAKAYYYHVAEGESPQNGHTAITVDRELVDSMIGPANKEKAKPEEKKSPQLQAVPLG